MNKVIYSPLEDYEKRLYTLHDTNTKNFFEGLVKRSGVDIEENRKTAEKYYNKYIKNKIGRQAICFPSTSPANAAWSVEKLTDSWKIIKTN